MDFCPYTSFIVLLPREEEKTKEKEEWLSPRSLLLPFLLLPLLPRLCRFLLLRFFYRLFLFFFRLLLLLLLSKREDRPRLRSAPKPLIPAAAVSGCVRRSRRPTTFEVTMEAVMPVVLVVPGEVASAETALLEAAVVGAAI